MGRSWDDDGIFSWDKSGKSNEICKIPGEKSVKKNMMLIFSCINHHKSILKTLWTKTLKNHFSPGILMGHATRPVANLPLLHLRLALPPGFVVWPALHILPCLFIYIYTQIQTVIVTKPLYSHYIPIKIKSDSIPMIGWWYEVILSNKLKGYNVYSQFYSDPLW